MSDSDTSSTDTTEQTSEETQTFTQADVDRIVKDRLAQQAKNKFGDYDELKQKAGQSKTLEDRFGELEKRAATAEARALRSDIAAKHGISAEDRDLFLTGADEDTLTAQAERLAARDRAVKKTGNTAPKEGATITTDGGQGEEREFVGNLFGTSD